MHERGLSRKRTTTEGDTNLLCSIHSVFKIHKIVIFKRSFLVIFSGLHWKSGIQRQIKFKHKPLNSFVKSLISIDL